ncbi:MAG TPA: transcriptional repressor LexA, partial [Methylomirabilota bacterium]|nr:transcriptional repressor LexA [Methylomirabilota bacterium]
MSSVPVKDLQARIYDFIKSYSEQNNGTAPSIREIGNEFGIASTNHIDYHLNMLEKRGLILRQRKKARSITIVEQDNDKFGILLKGEVAAGEEPLTIYSETNEMINLEEILKIDGIYAMTVKGDSMIDEQIREGDYIFIKPQTTCDKGDIVVAVHRKQGLPSEAVLKRFTISKENPDIVCLRPANSTVKPILISKREWYREWAIQGKVIAVFRRY